MQKPIFLKEFSGHDWDGYAGANTLPLGFGGPYIFSIDLDDNSGAVIILSGGDGETDSPIIEIDVFIDNGNECTEYIYSIDREHCIDVLSSEGKENTEANVQNFISYADFLVKEMKKIIDSNCENKYEMAKKFCIKQGMDLIS